MRASILLFFLACSAYADVVYLRNGGKLEGRVTEKRTTYVIETAYGAVTLKKSDVLRVEKRPWEPRKAARPNRALSALSTKYSHPFLALRLYLPPKWRAGPASGKAACSFYGPKDVAYTPRVDLRIQRSTQDLAGLIGLYKTGYRKVDPQVIFPFEEAFQIGGRNAYQFSAIFRSDWIPYQALWTFVDRGDHQIVVSYSCTQAWFEKYYSKVDSLARSLRFYPPPALPRESRQRFLRLYNDGQAAYAQKRYRDALRLYEEAARLLPDFPDVHGLRGQAHWRLREFDAAKRAYGKAIELDPEDPDPHYNLGVILLLRSEYDGAVAALERAVRTGPAFEPALTNLGVAYLAKERHGQALAILDRAVLLDPESITAQYNLALACERSGKPARARRHYKEALKIDPDHAAAKEGLRRVGSKP